MSIFGGCCAKDAGRFRVKYDVVYLDRAEKDLAEIKAALLAYSRNHTAKTINAILDAVDNLYDNPLMYEAYRKDKRYRRIPVADYIVLYRVMKQSNRVEIMRVIYGRTNYKKNR